MTPNTVLQSINSQELEFLEENAEGGLHDVGVWVLRHFSNLRLSAIPWTIACQAPLSVGFSRQEYWTGLSCPLPGDLLDPGIKPSSLTSPELAGGFYTTWEAHIILYVAIISFVDMTPKAQATEEKTDKTGLHKNVNISGHSRTQSTE